MTNMNRIGCMQEYLMRSTSGGNKSEIETLMVGLYRWRL